jgi:hypothetical protein
MHSWVLTIDGQPSAASNSTTGYKAPVLTGVSGVSAYGNVGLSSLDTSGGEVVTLVRVSPLRAVLSPWVELLCSPCQTGDNFGPVSLPPVGFRTSPPLAPSVLLSNPYNTIAEASNTRACLIVQCYVVVAHTGMVCVTQPEVGSGFRWAVRVGGQYSGTAPQTTAYRPPVLSSVFGEGAFGSLTLGGAKVGWLPFHSGAVQCG